MTVSKVSLTERLPSLSGKSALHWAAAVNNVDATIALLKNGANKDMQDLKVWNLLNLSAFSIWGRATGK